MFSLGGNATLEATHADFFGDETEVGMSNITTTYQVSSTLNTRIHKDHSLDHVIGDVQSGVYTRRMTKTTNEQGFISAVYEGKTHEDLHTCLFACFLSQEEPKRIAKALSDSAWVEAMQEDLLHFKLQKVWILVDLPKGKRAISTKWVFKNKKDERGIMIQNKVRLVGQGDTQKEGIDYDEVFAPTPVADETVHKERGDSMERAATTATSLDVVVPGAKIPYWGTDLLKLVESLETDLKQTKKIYGASYTRLIKKVKILEKTVKSSQARRRERIVVSDDEDYLEDPSK
ncbi:putative ribonuclease H-like domain-containing protein [Tanacetum coccineum]